MKAPFEEFKVRPNGFGAGHFTVICSPHMGFWEQIRNLFKPGVPPYYPTFQEEFIEDAIRYWLANHERLEREGEK